MIKKSRIFSILLIFIMLFSVVPTFAASKIFNVYPDRITKINGTDFSGYTATPGTDNGAIMMYSTSYQTNYKINVLESGYYTLNTLANPYYSNYSTLVIKIDGEIARAFTVCSPQPENEKRNIECRKFYMEKGEHEFSLKIESGMVKIYSFTIKKENEQSKKTEPYRNYSIPAVIQAEDFDNGEIAKDSVNIGGKYRKNTGIDIHSREDSVYSEKGKYFISLYPSECVSYTFYATSSGVYDFSAVRKTSRGDKIKVYFDDFKEPLSAKLSEGETEIASLYIEKGKHVFKVAADGEYVDLDSFRFKTSNKNGVKLSDLASISYKEPPKEEKAEIFKEFYVSENGNDSFDGSKEKPFKTIGAAKKAAEAINNEMTGDIVVNVLDGIYDIKETEVFSKESGGKNGFEVIFKGTGNSIISGGTEITGWEKYDSELWRVKAPNGVTDVRNLYINDMPATRAQSKYTYTVKSVYDDPTTPQAKDGIRVSIKNFPASFTNIEDIELIWSIEWTAQVTPVYDIIYEEENETVLILLDEIAANLAAAGATATTPAKVYQAFTIDNAFELLDSPGEFYFNKKDGYIYYYPFKAENLETAKTYIGSTEGLLRIEGDSEEKVQNLTFKNLSFKYGAWSQVTKYGLVASQAESLYKKNGIDDMSNFVLSQISVNNAENINFRDCIFTCLGSTALGMNVNVSDCEISGSLFTDISGGAMSIGSHIPDNMPLTNKITIKNNMITRVSDEYRFCPSVSIYYVYNVDFVNNEIYDSPYTGLSVGWGWGTKDPEAYGDIRILNNRIENVMTSLKDGSHIYTLGPQRNTIIKGNYFNKSVVTYIGGIYYDAGSKYILATENVIADVPGWFHRSGYNWIQDVYLYNNYATTSLLTGPGHAPSMDLEAAHITTDGNWPDEALAIMENAGLEGEYAYLREKAEEPQWKVGRLETALKSAYQSKSRREGWIEAEDFLDGGEGVGYHKINAKIGVSSYRPEYGVPLLSNSAWAGYVIHENFPSEWLAYDMEVSQDGEYYIDIAVAHAWGEDQEQPACNIYIDDELVIENFVIPKAKGWNDITTYKAGTANIKAGKHIFKYEILGNGHYIDAFRVHDGSAYNISQVGNNEADYDEGKRVYE